MLSNFEGWSKPSLLIKKNKCILQKCGGAVAPPPPPPVSEGLIKNLLKKLKVQTTLALESLKLIEFQFV